MFAQIKRLKTKQVKTLAALALHLSRKQMQGFNNLKKIRLIPVAHIVSIKT